MVLVEWFVVAPVTLHVFGRAWEIPLATASVAQLSFEALCGEAHSAADYVELAQRFKILFITNIPRLTFNKRDEARRFITLIDALYENKVIANRHERLEREKEDGLTGSFFPPHVTRFDLFVRPSVLWLPCLI